MLRDGIFLLEKGVPYDAVFGPVRRPLSPTRRLALIVAAGENAGGEFDWDRRRWRERK